MKLTNPFIGYVTRSYLQIKQDVLTKFQNLVPEITDHTESNPWVKGLSIWASIAEMLGYYLDASAREVFIPTATKFSSLVKIAKLFDYRVRGVLSSSVDVTFYIVAPAGEDILIPAETVVKTVDDISFITVDAVTILTGETEITVGAIQQTKVEGVLLGVSDGSPEQIYSLEESVVDKQILVTVDANTFNPVDTFAFNYNDDRVFVPGLDENGIMILTFGDDINGKIPASGKQLVADYYVSNGAAGNVGSNTITQIASAVTVPNGVTLKVTNDLGAAGGADIESTSDLKRKIPLSFRTQNRAVTRQDYIDIAALAPGVAKAGIVFECGKTVDLFVVPLGGGIASSQLLSDVSDYFDERKMITTNVLVFPAGEVNVIISADVYVLPNFVRGTVINEVKNNIKAFLSFTNQNVNGSVRIGDIYEIFETTNGVDYSRVNLVITVPFPRPINNTKPLTFSATTRTNSVEVVKWKIKVIDGSIYELYKGTSYINKFNFGASVTQVGVKFTVSAGAYDPGDEWEFVVYPYNQNVELDEPSVPVTDDQYLTITGFGGLAS